MSNNLPYCEANYLVGGVSIFTRLNDYKTFDRRGSSHWLYDYVAAKDGKPYEWGMSVPISIGTSLVLYSVPISEATFQTWLAAAKNAAPHKKED